MSLESRLWLTLIGSVLQVICFSILIIRFLLDLLFQKLVHEECEIITMWPDDPQSCDDNDELQIQLIGGPLDGAFISTKKDVKNGEIVKFKTANSRVCHQYRFDKDQTLFLSCGTEVK